MSDLWVLNRKPGYEAAEIADTGLSYEAIADHIVDSSIHKATPAEILAAAANLDGAKTVKLPDSVYDLNSVGGEWSDYLVIPLPEKETPNE